MSTSVQVWDDRVHGSGAWVDVFRDEVVICVPKMVELPPENALLFAADLFAGIVKAVVIAHTWDAESGCHTAVSGGGGS